MARGKPALQTFIENFVGGNYVVAITNVTVTTTPTRVAQNDFERMALTFINVGAADLHMTPSNTVTSSQGIALGHDGGSLSLAANEDLALVGWDWWAVVATGTTTVTVVTVTRYQGSAE